MSTIDPNADDATAVPGVTVQGGPGAFLPTAGVADERQLVVARTFDAPRELVWRTLTELEHLSRWWGPRGFTTTTESIEVAVGGQWRFVMHGPDGTDYPNRIVYEEIEAPSRIVYRHDDGGEDGDPSGDDATCGFRTVIRLDEVDGRTRVELRMNFATPEEREETRRLGAVEGGLSTLGRLGGLLRDLAGGEPRRPLGLALPSPTEILLQRSFAAPRQVVWEAYTDPEQVRRWYGGATMDLAECEADLRPGGRFRRLVETAGERFTLHGEYREVEPPERLVFTEAFESAAASTPPGDETVSTVTLEEEAGVTTLTRHVLHPSRESRDAQLRHGMEGGAVALMDRLADRVAELAELAGPAGSAGSAGGRRGDV